MKRSPLKRRTPMKRGQGLKRGGYLDRSTPINPRNEERIEKRRAQNFGALADFIRTLPCCACNIDGPSDPAHVHSVGAGGHAWNEDGTSNIIPLCRICHTVQHAQGWGALFGDALRPRDVAEQYAKEYGEDFILAGGSRY